VPSIWEWLERATGATAGRGSWHVFETLSSGSVAAAAAGEAATNFSKGDIDKESWTELGASIGNALHVAGKTGGMDWAFGNVMIRRQSLADAAATRLEFEKIRLETNLEGKVGDAVDFGKDKIAQGAAKVEEHLLDPAKDLLRGAKDAVADGLWFPTGENANAFPKIKGLEHDEARVVHEWNRPPGGDQWYPKYDKTDEKNPVERAYRRLTDDDKIPAGPGELNQEKSVITRPPATVTEGDREITSFRIKTDLGQKNYVIDEIKEVSVNGNVTERSMIRNFEELTRPPDPAAQAEQWRTWGRAEGESGWDAAKRWYQDPIGLGKPGEKMTFSERIRWKKPEVDEQLRRFNAEEQAKIARRNAPDIVKKTDTYVVTEKFDSEGRCVQRVLVSERGSITETLKYGEQERGLGGRLIELGSHGEISSTRVLRRADGTTVFTTSRDAEGVTSLIPEGRSEVLKQKVYFKAPDKGEYLTKVAEDRNAEFVAAQEKARLEELARAEQAALEEAARTEKLALQAEREARAGFLEDLLDRPKAPLREVNREFNKETMKESVDPSVWLLTWCQNILLVLLGLSGFGEPEEGHEELQASRDALAAAYADLKSAVAKADEWVGDGMASYNRANNDLMSALQQADGLVKQLYYKVYAGNYVSWSLSSDVDYLRMVLSIILGVVMLAEPIAIKIAQWIGPIQSLSFQITVVTSNLPAALQKYLWLQTKGAPRYATDIQQIRSELDGLTRTVKQILTA